MVENGNSSNVKAVTVEFRKIMVDGIPSNTTKESLVSILGVYGEIEEGPTGFETLPNSKFSTAVDGRRRSFITYRTYEAACAAVVDPYKSSTDGRICVLCRWATVPPNWSRFKHDIYMAYAEKYRDQEFNGTRLEFSFEDTFGRVVDLPDLQSKRVVSRVSPSVIALSSYSAGRFLFACSGTILEEREDSFIGLTSASLQNSNSDRDSRLFERCVAADLKIVVHMNGDQFALGYLCCYDWNYNIAIVTFRKINQSRELMASYGNVLSKASDKFDCQELMVSSSKITKPGIGGPLIDAEGKWIGITFYDLEETPFLPGICVRRLVSQLMEYKNVLHPWTGLNLRTLATMPEPEILLERVDDMNGLVVLQVVEGSPAYLSGIRKGDMIMEVENVSLSYVAQFTGELLLKSERERNNSLASTFVKVDVKRIDGPTFSVNMALQNLPNNHRNSWSVPMWQINWESGYWGASKWGEVH